MHLTLWGSKICHPKMCLFGIRINLGCLFLRNRGLRSLSFYLPLNCRMYIKGLFLEQRYRQRYLQRIWARCGGQTQQGLQIRVRSVSHCVCLAQKPFIYQTFAFSSPCQLPSSPLKSQTSTPNNLFCLQLRMVLKIRVLAILAKLVQPN